MPTNSQKFLVKNIKKGGYVNSIMQATRKEVLTTDSNQLIWSEESLLDDICFDNLIPEPKPIQDSDEDGLLDKDDECPHIYGRVSNNGCRNDDINLKNGID